MPVLDYPHVGWSTKLPTGLLYDLADGLAKLIAHLLEPRGEDPLLRGAVATRITSRELRSFLVLPTFDDIGLTVALEHRGIRSVPMDDARASMRCLNLPALASRLDVGTSDLFLFHNNQAYLWVAR